MNDQPASKTWLKKIAQALTLEPGSRSELIELLRSSQQKELIDGDALKIIEGALTVSDKQVREIMIPRSQVVFIRADQEPDEFLPVVIGSGHSRFPVIGEGDDEILGILLAKDLLALAQKDRAYSFELKNSLRSHSAIPESKRLDVLLQEFRATKNHLAVVYDEYGGVSGIVTIEDVLEQIVGDIEDEYDFEEEGPITENSDGTIMVRALTSVEDFNDYFDADLVSGEFETIGGVVTHAFGHLPGKGEQVEIDDLCFEVINSDGRRVHLFKVVRIFA
ncbi:MAG: magnesium/cobalt efflux protein [Gammaproteobacteria bacterium]|nr:magnesium/cobalt efflux protein [Gammaproteobacteria bacterium]|tara:strand:+ start:308 stop:1138 length:831 start_codon:yes stop_codon:yes gene_type:complete